MEIETIRKQIKFILIGENVNLTDKSNKIEVMEFLNERIKTNIEEAEKELFISSNGKCNNLNTFYSNQKEFQPTSPNFTKLLLQNNLLIKNLIQLNKL
jgi:hypothetical protein